MTLNIDLSGGDSEPIIISDGVMSDDEFIKNMDKAMSCYIKGQFSAAMMHLRDGGVFLSRTHDINMPFIG